MGFVDVHAHPTIDNIRYYSLFAENRRFSILTQRIVQSNLFEGEKLQVVRHLAGTDRTVLLTSYFDECVEDVSTPLFSACRTLNEIILIVRENGRDVYSMYIR